VLDSSNHRNPPDRQAPARPCGPRLVRLPHTRQTEPQVHDVEQDDAERRRTAARRRVANNGHRPEVRRDVWGKPQDPGLRGFKLNLALLTYVMSMLPAQRAPHPRRHRDIGVSKRLEAGTIE
jgi:hypothetical protein